MTINKTQVDQQFRLTGHNFNNCVLIRLLNDTNIHKELLKYKLKD